MRWAELPISGMRGAAAAEELRRLVPDVPAWLSGAHMYRAPCDAGTWIPWVAPGDDRHRPHTFEVRRVAGPPVKYVKQCTVCGHRSKNVAKKSVPHVPPPFDDDLPERVAEWTTRVRAWLRQYRGAAGAELAQKERDDWWARYNRYLRSGRWADRRAQVLERDKWRCLAQLAGCTGRAEQVHHLDYANLGDEPLWELVSICTHCHDTITERERARR